MINHIRTLLMNRGGDHGYGYDYPGEEFVLPTFRAKAVPAFLNGALRLLLGTNPDRLFLNYRMRQIMSLLHSTELNEFIYLPDSRVTYWPMADDNFMDTFTAETSLLQVGAGGIESWMLPIYLNRLVGGVSYGGTVEDLWYEDGSYVYGNELDAGGVAYETRFAWGEDVPNDQDLVVHFRGYYTGTTGMNPQFHGDEAPGGATTWTSLTGETKDLPDGGSANIALDIPLDAKYIDKTFMYNVELRLQTLGTGNAANFYYIDQLTLGYADSGDESRLFIAGHHEPDESAGILEQQWRVEVIDDSTAQITRQSPPLTTTSESFTTTDKLTSEIPLAGTGLKCRISEPAAGATWLITSRAKPQNDFGATLQSAARLIVQSGIDKLFLSADEPIPTLKAVWETHPQFPYKYSALLLAIAYYLDKMDAVGGIVQI